MRSKTWNKEHADDPFVQRAHKEGWRSRAVYKLEELDKKYNLIQQGMNIVDLGAAPGGWSQYVAKKVGKTGKLIAIDVLDMDSINNVHFLKGDFTEQAVFDQIMTSLNGQKVDLVLSDMAPNITGIALQDQARYERLLESVLSFCETALRPGGVLLTKFFEGESAQLIRTRMKAQFNQLKTIKPGASRTHSKELYLLALNRK